MNTNATTAMEDDFKTHMMRRQHSLLRDHPQIRAERIARHYLAHAQLALEMVKFCDIRKRQQEPSPQLDKMIDRHMKTIVENHRNDFGIELSWDKPTPP